MDGGGSQKALRDGCSRDALHRQGFSAVPSFGVVLESALTVSGV